MRLAYSIRVSVLVTAIFCFATAGDGLAADQPAIVRIGGTGCALGGVKLAAEAFQKRNPDITVTIVPSLGSSGGIKAVLAGALDIALSARPLSDAEQAQGGSAAAYARTPFLFATSGRAQPLSLTLREVVSIYAGITRQWPDGTALRLVLRPTTDTDIDILRHVSPDMDAAVQQALSRKGLVTAVTDQENADMLAKLSGSFGAATLSQILSEKRPLSPVTLDGVAPSLANLASGAYPYSKTLYAITGPRSPAPARRFLDYLMSPEGIAILRRSGHLAAAEKP